MGSFRRLACLATGVTVLASALVSHRVVNNADAAAPLLNLGKANQGGSFEKARPVPVAKDEFPESFAPRIEEPKGTGSPDWVGKSDPASNDKRAKYFKDLPKDSLPPGAFVEGLSNRELLDKSLLTDGDLPKIAKSRKQIRKDAKQIDEPVLEDDSKPRGPKLPPQPKPGGPLPPKGVPQPQGAGIWFGPSTRSEPPIKVELLPPNTAVSPKPGRKVIDLRPKPVAVEPVGDDGDWVATIERAKVRMSDLDDPSGTVQIETALGVEVGFIPLGKGARARPEKSARRVGAKRGVKVVWDSAFADGSSLIEEVTSTGVKGSIMLPSAPNAIGDGVWQFELVLSDGLTPVLGNGSVVDPAFRVSGRPVSIFDPQGELVGTVPAGVAVDAAGAEVPVDLELRRAAGSRWVLEVAVDGDWLSDKARLYPVAVDPTFTVAAPAGGANATSVDGVVVARHGYTSDLISDQLPGYGTRNLLQLFNLASLGAGASATSAILNVHVGNCSAPNAWSPYAFKVGVSPMASSFQAPATAVPSSYTGPVWAQPTQYGSVLSFNITPWVQNWLSGGWVNNGLRFEMERYGWPDQPNSCELFVDNLVIDVPNRAPTGTLSSPANLATSVSVLPTLSVAASDPDGDPMAFFFESCHPSIAAAVACTTSGWITSSSWMLASQLPYFQSVEWRAWVYTAPSSSVLLGQRSFTTQGNPSGAPTITQLISPGANAIGQLIRPTFSATAMDPTGDALQYRFRVCRPGCQDELPEWNSGWLPQNVNQWTIAVNLPFQSQLHWQVEVKDASNTVASNWQTFTTVAGGSTPPPVPVLVWPPDTMTGLPNRPALAATVSEPVQMQYTVCLYPAGAPCKISGWGYGSWQPGPADALVYGAEYEWFAQSQHPPTAGVTLAPSAFSGKRRFRVGANPTGTPTPPVAVAPVSGSSVTSRPILQVSGSTDTDGDPIEFMFQICAPDFAPVDAHCLTSTWRSKPTWQVIGSLDWNRTYKWRAFVRNVVDTGSPGIPMADAQSVTVSTPTTDDVAPGASGFNPYVELDGEDAFNGGVNEALGQLTYSRTDVVLPSVVPGLEVTRTYNARLRTNSVFGRGFFSNLDARIVRKANSGSLPGGCDDCAPVEVILPDGRREYFSRLSNEEYVSGTKGFYSDLKRIPSSTIYPNFLYVLDNRSKIVFDANGRLIQFEDRNGNKLVYGYASTPPNRLESLTDDKSGRTLYFFYNALGKIDKVRTVSVSAHGAVLETSYNYSGDYLQSVCPPVSSNPVVTGCWQYSWSGDRLTKVTKPKGNAEFEVGYDTQGFLVNNPVNLATNPSFELATSGWVSVTGASASAISTETALYGSKSLKGNLEPGKAISVTTQATIPVEPNKQYSISAFVKGAVAGGSSGNVIPYWEGFDQFGQTIVDVAYNAGGSALQEGDTTGFATMDQWTPIRGSFRTTENTKFVKIRFVWPTPTAAVYLDGVSLIKGDALTNRVQWRKDGRGNTTNYTYAFNGPNVEVITTSPRGIPASTSVYNDKLQLISSTDAGGRITSYEYDSNGFLSKIKDPANRETILTNDERGNVRERKWSWMSPARSEYFQYKVDAGGGKTDLLSEFRDARSASPTDPSYLTKYTYDSAGNRTAEIDPTNASKVWTYALPGAASTAAIGGGSVPVGRVVAHADRSGLVIGYGYNTKGDLYKIDHPGNGVTEFQTDEIGRTIAERVLVNGVLDAESTMTYDVRSRPLTATEQAVLNRVTNIAHRARVTNLYDSNGNPTSVTVSDLAAAGADSSRTTGFTYTLDDQLESITEPLGRQTVFQYDQVGNRVRTYDPRQVRTRTYFNDRNLPESTFLENYFDTPTATFVAPTTGTRAIRIKHTTYDVLGRVDEVTDARDRVTRFEYWPDDQIKKIATRTAGSALNTEIVTSYREYDNVGNPTLVRSGETETVRNTFDSRGFLSSRQVDPTGLNRVTSFSYDAEGRPLTAATGRLVESNTYHSASKLLASTGKGGIGAVTSFLYDGRGRLASRTSGRGFVTSYVYDSKNRLIKAESPTTKVWTNGVESNARPTSEAGYNTFGERTDDKDPLGRVTTIERDVLGQQKKVTYPTNQGVTPTETFAYDFAGNMTSYIDRRGQTTDFTVDAFGRTGTTLKPAPVAGGARPTTTVTFDDVSQQVQIVDPNGVTTKAAWDVLGRQASSSVIMRQKENEEWKTTYTYDNAGRQKSVTDPLLKVWSTDYNGAGQVRKSTDPTGAETATTFEEPMGWVSAVTFGGRRKTKNTYDDAGRLRQSDAVNIVNDAIIASDKYEYDFDSNMYRQTRPNNAVDTTLYDELNRVAGSQNEIASVSGTKTYAATSAGFDAAGNQVRVVDARGHITTSTYNNWNQLASTVEPSTLAHPNAADRTWTVGYSAAGDPVSETIPGGVNVSRTFDLLGRLKSETGSGPAANSATRTFDYDAGGRRTNAGAQGFSYFDSGHLQSSTGPSGTSSFDIDKAGRTISRVDASGSSSFDYTDRGELKTYNVAGASVGLTWNPDGVVKDITYPMAVTRMFGYDEMGRLTDDHTKTSTGQNLTRRQYTYNPDSTVASATIAQAGAGVVPPGTIQPSFIPATGSGSRDVLVTASHVYWTNLATGTIGRANLDGTGVNQNFITGIDAPSGIASDGTYLYWTTGGLNDNAGTGGVARSLLDGTSRNNTFITGANKPIGLAVNATHIFWTNFNSGGIGRAAKDGTGKNHNFIATGQYTYGLEVSGSHVYWTKFLSAAGGVGTNIGRADIGGTNVNAVFITGANAPGGIATDGTYLYWSNLTSIGRAGLDGAGVNQTYISSTFPGPGTLASPVSLTANATNLYFSNQASQQIARVSQGGGSGGPVENYSYSYDSGARLTGFTGPTGSTTYSYDAAGNRLTANGATFTYDQRNRLLAGGGLSYSWSPRGTLVSTTGTGGATYTYDGLDRMTGAGGVTYTYDSLDRIASRSGAPGFAYSGVETDPVAEGTNLYRRSPSGSLLGLSRGGVSVLAGLERHGDLAFTLNPSTGTIVDTVTNDPFGRTLSVTGSKPNTGFQGDWTDPTNGIVWMAARWYNPNTGTFVSRDTYPGSVGAYGTLNRYTYGLNDPVRYWDPTGRFSDSRVWEAIVGFWGSVTTNAAVSLVSEGTGSYSDPNSYAGQVAQYATTWLGDAFSQDSYGLAATGVALATNLKLNSASYPGTDSSYSPAYRSASLNEKIVTSAVNFSIGWVASTALGYVGYVDTQVQQMSSREFAGSQPEPWARRAYSQYKGEWLFNDFFIGGTLQKLSCAAGLKARECFTAEASLNSFIFSLNPGWMIGEGVKGRNTFTGEKYSGSERIASVGLGVLSLAGSFGALKAGAKARATKTGTGASNAATGPALARQLAGEEASSIFTSSGGLQRSVINSSTEIIPGTSLKNTQLIKNLTADGSNLADWGKYTTQTFSSPSGPFQVHFYMNSSTGAVHYLDDFKVVFNGRR